MACLIDCEGNAKTDLFPSRQHSLPFLLLVLELEPKNFLVCFLILFLLLFLNLKSKRERKERRIMIVCYVKGL